MKALFNWAWCSLVALIAIMALLLASVAAYRGAHALRWRAVAAANRVACVAERVLAAVDESWTAMDIERGMDEGSDLVRRHPESLGGENGR